MVKATAVKRLDDWRGDARLFKLSEPVQWGGDYDGDEAGETNFIVVSAAVAPFSGPETYIFAADENGKVVDWGEMSGSYRGGLSHETAIANAGWCID